MRAALEELGLPVLRVLVSAYVFSGFYWSVGAADVRGGGEKDAEGREGQAGGVMCGYR